MQTAAITSTVASTGNDAHRDDLNYIAEILLAILLDTFTNCQSYGLADYAKDRSTLKKRLMNEGVSFATRTLPRFFNDFAKTIEGSNATFAGFRAKAGRPLFLRALTGCILEEGTDDKIAFKGLYALCVAFKKLKGPYRNAVLRKELRDFVETDKELGNVNFTSPYLLPITTTARDLITELFDGLDPEDALKAIPKPGPGATNSHCEPHMRYEPHVRYGTLETAFPTEDWFYTANPWDLVNRAREYLKLPVKGEPTSRFKFIHKYVDKPRGICIEENETQWCQQAMKRMLYDHIEHHTLTAGMINFSNQEINRLLALESSATRRWMTIDMSAASNRVLRELVLFLFLHTELFEYLNAVSTRVITLPPGLGQAPKMLTNMFAPMGSGVCFPVMAVVHWALIKAIVQHTASGDAREDDSRIYVYGDDIIVDSKLADCIYTHLPMYGMKINETKSYHKSFFRESCGLHAFKGFEVTPVYNNYTLTTDTSDEDSTTLLSSIAKEALYFHKGFPSVSRVIRRRASAIYGNLPYAGPDSPVLSWKRESMAFTSEGLKAHAVKKRYHAEYQSYEYRYRCVVPRFEDSTTVDDSRGLLRWVTTNSNDAATFAGSVEDLRIRYKWIPEQALSTGQRGVKVISGTYKRRTPDAAQSFYLGTLHLATR